MLLDQERLKREGVGVASKMNRSQRRKLEREQGKEVAQYNAQAKWLDTLLPWQKKVIDKMLREAKVDAEIECIEVVSHGDSS